MGSRHKQSRVAALDRFMEGVLAGGEVGRRADRQAANLRVHPTPHRALPNQGSLSALPVAWMALRLMTVRSAHETGRGRNSAVGGACEPAQPDPVDLRRPPRPRAIAAAAVLRRRPFATRTNR